MGDFWDEQGEGSAPRRPGGGRRRRVDVRAAILRLLAERPMNGSELSEALERQAGGRWRPRPETVYATLQMLEDEGLVKAVVSEDGRRRHELTEPGRAEAERLAADSGPREAGGDEGSGASSSAEDLFGAIADAARVFVAAAASADREQRARLVTALRQFRAAVLEAVPDAERGHGPVPPWAPWAWGRGPWAGAGRGWADFPSWLASFGAGAGGGPWGRGRPWSEFGHFGRFGPAAERGDDEEGEDEIW